MAGPESSAKRPQAAPDSRALRGAWFRDWLRFSCAKCGECCRDADEESFVFLYEGDSRRMAKAMSLGEDEFARKYVTSVGGCATLRNSGRDCVMLSPSGTCSVYRARPLQCRAWPFWPENLKKRSSWQSKVAGKCPGAGRGRLHHASEIAALMQRQKAAWLMIIGPGLPGESDQVR